MGFFTSSPKKAPEPEQTGPVPIPIEKMHDTERKGMISRRQSIGGSFGTTDLDYVLKSYAPEHVAKIDKIEEQNNSLLQGMLHTMEMLHSLAPHITKLEQQNQELKDELVALKKQRTPTIIK